jgi:hypothetical protein
VSEARWIAARKEKQILRFAQDDMLRSG